MVVTKCHVVGTLLEPLPTSQGCLYSAFPYSLLSSGVAVTSLPFGSGGVAAADLLPAEPNFSPIPLPIASEAAATAPPVNMARREKKRTRRTGLLVICGAS